MSQKTTVKRDFLGLYVVAGGWIARPFNGTVFNEGDLVKSHHFGGSTDAGVTTLDNNFKRDGHYELWTTTGTSSTEYSKLTEQEIESKYDWYKETMQGALGKIRKDHNTEFAKRIKIK